MITTKSDSNSSKYIALFEDAFNFLKEHALEKDEFPATLEDRELRKQILQEMVDNGATRFTSVQEYFSHIQDLLILHDENANINGRKYLMLPLDEPVFEIDANKREILVPAEFKKNGISVQGDEIAESLIFKINRFFDYADLLEMKPVVQWENANKETGTSSIFVVDDSRNAEYLYLMWPLKEEITKYPGTIKFSLRFYEVSGNDLIYSFSTKIAAATINAGHDFSYEKLNTNVIDAAGNFAEAIKNSKNTAKEDAATPYFILNLNEVLAGQTPGEENADYIVNEGILPHLEAYIDAVDNPVQKLRVQATANDTGIVSYTWFYNDTVDTSIEGGRKYYLVPQNEYIETADLLPVAHKVYYRKDGDNYLATEFTGDDTMYEKYSVVEVRSGQLGKANAMSDPEALLHVVGKYYAVAKNSVGDNWEDAQSYIIEFPAPEKLAYTEDGNLPANMFLSQAGTGTLEVTIEIDENAKDTYMWEYGTSLTGPFTPISGDTSTLTATEKNKLSADGNSLLINDLPGFYRVRAISTRNYETIEELSAVTKVTPVLAAPVITYPKKDKAVSSLYTSATLEVQVQAFESVYESEGLTYQWYKWVNGEIEAIEGETGRQLVVPQGTDDAFCCEVSNHMGEFVETSRSYNFSVQPFRPADVEDDDEEDEPAPVVTPDPVLAISGATKVAVAPGGDHQAEAQANQDAVQITRNGNNIVISGDLANLYDYPSSVQAQGTHKWVAIDIDTGLNSIVGATWRGEPLTQADEDEAIGLGLGAGHIVYWAKADVIAVTPDNIVIGATGYSDVTVVVTFEDTQG